MLNNSPVAEVPEGAARGGIDQPMLVAGVAIADMLILIVTAMLASLVMPTTSPFWTGAALSGVALMTMQRLWAYTIPTLGSAVRQISRVALGLVASFGMMMAVVYMLAMEAAVPRQFALLWFGLSLATIAATRLGIAWQVGRWITSGQLMRRAIVVGGGRQAEELIRQLRQSRSAGIKVCGVFDDRAKDRAVDAADRYRVIGSFDEMTTFCREQDIDLIIVTLPSTAEDRILNLLKKLWVLPIDIRVSAHHSKLRLRPRAYSYIGDIPFLAVFDKPLSDWGWAVKEIEDRVIAAIALVLLSPVMIGVALAVRFTSKGPVLFKQKRHGFNNQLVEVYKFRSMYTDMCDAKASKLVTKDDPRVTPVGRIIRKTSLDELPQLFNVLKGELSLVGPRPHATACRAGERLYNEVVDGYYARHRMKPGITGLAQINGWRGETDTEEKLQRRVEYDLQYIDNWSVWMDLYILAMTPVSLLNTKNAY
jgi:Undecaprenyl-phosphate glucose phosphotransferase